MCLPKTYNEPDNTAAMFIIILDYCVNMFIITDQNRFIFTFILFYLLNCYYYVIYLILFGPFYLDKTAICLCKERK